MLNNRRLSEATVEGVPPAAQMPRTEEYVSKVRVEEKEHGVVEEEEEVGQPSGGVRVYESAERIVGSFVYCLLVELWRG